jgi:hypothetical protein
MRRKKVSEFEAIGNRLFVSKASGGDPKHIGKWCVWIEVAQKGETLTDCRPISLGDGVIFHNLRDGARFRRTGILQALADNEPVWIGEPDDIRQIQSSDFTATWKRPITLFPRTEVGEMSAKPQVITVNKTEAA